MGPTDYLSEQQWESLLLAMVGEWRTKNEESKGKADTDHWLTALD